MRWLLACVLGTSLAHAQGPAKDQGALAPRSTDSFAPVAPEPATPAAEASSATPDPPAEAPPAAPAPPAAKPRPARVLVAPASEQPETAETVQDEEEDKGGAHVHDGFYMRLALGVGHISASTEKASTLSGWGVAPDIWIGGSPIPGLAIGVTFNGVSVTDPHAEITAADSGGLGPVSGDAPGTLTYSVFGLAGDFYPAPTGGLHFMAGINYSAFNFTADHGQETKPASGIGLLGGVGYEWWIGREWSVGPLARLHWASVSDAGTTFSILSPVLLLGFTYH